MAKRPRLPLVVLPASQEKVVRPWKKRIDAAEQTRKRHEQIWDILLRDYTPQVRGLGIAEEVTTNAHFRNVEGKKAMLLARLPKVILTPLEPLRDPATDQMGQPITDEQGQPLTAESVVPIKQAVLQKLLGPDEADLLSVADACLSDNLIASGMGIIKIGYRAWAETTEVETLDPLTQQPVMQRERRIIKEAYLLDRISPKAFLHPDGFASTQFDKAPWLAYRFLMPLTEARRLFQLPDDFEAEMVSDDDLRFRPDRSAGPMLLTDQVRGVYVEYKASVYDATVAHPDLTRELVFIEAEGSWVPVVHRPSPNQEIDPATGRLTADSLIGFSLEVLTIRDLPDSSYIPSDCAVTQVQVKELNTYRRQEVARRDANLPKIAYDPEKLPKEALEKIKKGEMMQFIPLRPGALASGKDSVFAEVAKGTVDRSTVDSMLMLEQDMEKALAIPATAPAITESDRTATEASLRQSNSQARLSKEQIRVQLWLLRIIRKFDALIQRWADDDDYIPLVGQSGVKRLQRWNRTAIAGRYAYDASLDSQIWVDANARREQLLKLHNFVGASPVTNQLEWTKELFTAFGYDPQRLTQPPPPPPPEKPNISFRFSGEDLNSPLVRQILVRSGILTAEEAQTLPAPLPPAEPQDGKVPEADRLDRSAEEETGQLPGPTSQFAPM